MRVRFAENYVAHIEGQYQTTAFTKGQEFDTPFAEQLLASGCPVVEVQDRMGDVDGDGVPDGNATEVLAWVGDDAAKAGLALLAETTREKPRSTLIAALEKIAAAES